MSARSDSSSLPSTDPDHIRALESENVALGARNAAFAREVETHTTAAAGRLQKMMSSLMMKKFGLNAELETCCKEVFERLDRVMQAVYRFSEAEETADKGKGE